MGVIGIEIIILVIVTAIVGYIGGLVGMPLGPIRLFFFLILGISPLVAIGTNLGLSFIAVVSVIWPHVKTENINYRIAFSFGVFSLLGSFLGGLISEYAPLDILIWFIVIFLFVSGLLIVQNVHFIKAKTDRENRKTKKAYTIAYILGILIGILGGATGLVLGALRYPILINYLKVTAKKTVGTNSLINLFVAIFGLTGHGLISGLSGNSHFSFQLFVPLALTVSVTSYLGAKSVGDSLKFLY